MALIKCPECSKEISDKANICINCGCPISVIKKIIYCNVSYMQIESIFNDGLSNNTVGNCQESNSTYNYRVENNILYITDQAGTHEFIIDEEYLVNKSTKYEGFIPDSETFDAHCQSKLGTIQFSANGTYTGNFIGTKCNGNYKKYDNIIIKCGNDTGNIPTAFLVYKNNLYLEARIKKEAIENILSKLSSFSLQNQIKFTTPTPTIQTKPLVSVNCPYCNSTNTKKISSSEKVFNIAMFGIFGNKRKYQWHCNNCNSDF